MSFWTKMYTVSAYATHGNSWLFVRTVFICHVVIRFTGRPSDADFV